MNIDQQSLKKNLNELVDLLKKLINKTSNLDIPGVDDSFRKNLNLLINNLEEFNDELYFELFNQFGNSFFDLIHNFVLLLQLEISNLEVQNPELLSDINQIDKLLSDPELHEIEINNLLDRRIFIEKLLT